MDCLEIYFSLVYGGEQFQNRTWQDMKKRINEDSSLRVLNYYKTVTVEKLRQVKEEMQRRRIYPTTLARASFAMFNLYLWIQATIECAEVNLKLDDQTRQALEFITFHEANRKRYRRLLTDKSFLHEFLQN